MTQICKNTYLNFPNNKKRYYFFGGHSPECNQDPSVCNHIFYFDIPSFPKKYSTGYDLSKFYDKLEISKVEGSYFAGGALGCSLTYNSFLDSLILFPGYTQGSLSNEIFIFNLQIKSWKKIEYTMFITRSLKFYNDEIYTFEQPVLQPSPRIYTILNSEGGIIRVDGGYSIYQNKLTNMANLWYLDLNSFIWSNYTPSWMYYSNILKFTFKNTILGYIMSNLIEISISDFPINTTIQNEEGQVVFIKNTYGLLSYKDFYINFKNWSDLSLCSNIDPDFPFQSPVLNLDIEIMEVYKVEEDKQCNPNALAFLQFWDNNMVIECSLQGKCILGTCVCDPGFIGPDCSIQDCQKKCYDSSKT